MQLRSYMASTIFTIDSQGERDWGRTEKGEDFPVLTTPWQRLKIQLYYFCMFLFPLLGTQSSLCIFLGKTACQTQTNVQAWILQHKEKLTVQFGQSRKCILFDSGLDKLFSWKNKDWAVVNLSEHQVKKWNAYTNLFLCRIFWNCVCDRSLESFWKT